MITWREAILGHFAIVRLDNRIRLISISHLLRDQDYIRTLPAYLPVTKERLILCSSSQIGQTKLERIDEDYINRRPVTMMETQPSKWNIVDGNHRYIKAYMLKFEMIPARYVHQKIWSRYVIQTDDNLPDFIGRIQFSSIAIGNRPIDRTDFVSLKSSLS